MNLKTLVLILILILSAPAISFAEYRVFLLKIAKKSADPNTPSTDFRQVQSTLDPIQYRYYYPVAADEEVSYTETWMCKGRTGDFQSFCPNPKGQIPTPGGATP